MIRRPPRSTQSRSSAASDVYKRQPYLLGVSGGAACGTLVGSLLGLGASAGMRAGIFDALALPFAAFLGALAAVLIVGIGASAGGRLDRGRLLLSGVVVNALASAILLFLLSFGDASRSRTFVFWMLGSLSGATPGAVLALSVYTCLLYTSPSPRD